MGEEKKSKKEPSAPWEDDSRPVYTKGSLDQIEKLVEENLRLTEEVLKLTKKINNFVLWSRIFSFLKILIIIVPIVLGIIYLPPLLKDVLGPYQELLGGNPLEALFKGGESINIENVDLENVDASNIPPELKKLLEK